MNNEVTFILPVIPHLQEGQIAHFVAGGEFTGPFVIGEGHINLRCGRCMHLLMQHLHPGQITNLIVKCSNPRCGAYNTIVSIPTVENLIGQLQKVSPIEMAQLSDLEHILIQAQKKGVPKEQLFTSIEQYMPDFAWIEKLVVPQSPGDFYGLLGCLIALLAWYRSEKPSEKATVRSITDSFLQANKTS